MKTLIATLAVLYPMSLAHAGMTRYVPDPPRFQHDFAGADESAEVALTDRRDVMEGRSVHEDSDRDEAHAGGANE